MSIPAMIVSLNDNLADRQTYMVDHGLTEIYHY